jgi:hypothetical protein
VPAALTEPWGHGQREGQIIRLKLIGWQINRPASFALLWRRILYQAAEKLYSVV